MHVALGLFRIEGVNFLCIAGCTQSGDSQHLCLSTLEQTRTMYARNEADFRREDGELIARAAAQQILMPKV